MALKKNNPGCGCCGLECDNCQAGTVPSTVTVTYPTGMTFGTCDFSNLNGQSFILAPRFSLYPCYYELVDAAFDWGVCDAGIIHSAEIIKSGTTYYKYVTVRTAWTTIEWLETTSHPSPVDCSATTALQCISHGYGDVYWN